MQIQFPSTPGGLNKCELAWVMQRLHTESKVLASPRKLEGTVTVSGICLRPHLSLQHLLSLLGPCSALML